MKELKTLESLKEYIESENRLGDLDYAHYTVMIDYIDVVIQGLEELNNRSCNNCKKQETLMCPVTSFSGNIEDFSCNRWESKC